MRFFVKHWRQISAVLLLEFLALALALAQYGIGVRTDEAKYLLSIPYPHPPLARFLLSLTESFPYQELLWRIVFATLLIQGVWLALAMARNLNRGRRALLAGMWLLSASVLLQAGTIMMAPLTALQGLLFLWLLTREGAQKYPGYIALLWLASLFTTYQAVLYAPIVWVLLRLSERPVTSDQRPAGSDQWSLVTCHLYFFIPLLLLGLYTLSNPLSLHAMFLQAGKDIAETPLERLRATLHVWAVGGSMIGSILGTIGIASSLARGSQKDVWNALALAGSFLLVLFFTLLARHEYYAILWTPLFAAGLLRLLSTTRLQQKSILAIGMLFWGIQISYLLRLPVSIDPSPARETMRLLTARGGSGSILLIAGSFGHEWQYESPYPVLRLTSGSDLRRAAAIVCLAPCAERSGWHDLAGVPVRVLLRD